jgi:AAHS family 4-hydroxybenzoate transporter-like MFS transporter
MNTVQTLDVRQHINSRKMSGYQWLLLFLCFLIVTTDGMDVAIMGFLAPSITKEWGISKAAFGVVMSAAPIGLAIGALLIGPLSDRYGRKRLLMVAVAWFGTFSILSSQANDVYQLSDPALPDRPRPGRGDAEHDHAAVRVRPGKVARQAHHHHVHRL